MFPIIQAPHAETAAATLRAITMMEPLEQLQRLRQAIVGRGGWILASDAKIGGELNLLFEFECKSSLEMYVALVSGGLSLSKRGHMDLTRMWQCARDHGHSHCLQIARIALTVFPVGAEQMRVSCAR